MKFKIKGWDKFQQYKDDRPMHWIKLHTSLLDDYIFNQLTELSQLHLIKLWLIAAKNNGVVEGDSTWLAKVVNAKKLDLKEIVQAGFLIRTDPYNSVLREEEKRGEKKREEKTREKDISVELKPDNYKVFDYWRLTMKHPKAQFDDKRKALINTFLKHYHVEDLKQAIHGCSVTPFNMGDNKQGQVYDSLSLIFKDADQVDRFMKNSIKPPQGNIRTINQSQDSIAAVTARLEAQMEQKIEAHNA